MRWKGISHLEARLASGLGCSQDGRTDRSQIVTALMGLPHSKVARLACVWRASTPTGEQPSCEYSETNRIRDRNCSTGDTSRFEIHFPDKRIRYHVIANLQDILNRGRERWSAAKALHRKPAW